MTIIVIWLKEMHNERCRICLDHCQALLQMRYYFDSKLGTFDTCFAVPLCTLQFSFTTLALLHDYAFTLYVSAYIPCTY